MTEANNKEFEMAVGTSNVLETDMMESENFYSPIETVNESDPSSQNNWSSTNNDTGQLCRSCANSSDYLIPIYEGEGLEHQLEHKIQKHLPIQVSSTDTLPLQLCYQCASTLIAWDSLISSCLEAEKKLKAMQEAAAESKNSEIFENSQAEDSQMVDSDDEPLITSKAKLMLEKNKATPIKKKILSKAKSKPVPLKAEKTAPNSKEVENKERSASAFGDNDFVSPPEKFSTELKFEGSEGKSENLTGNVNCLPDVEIKKFKGGMTCALCNKRLVTKQGYSRHMKNHLGDRSQTCHICGKCFLEKKDIARHVREVHDKIKKFVCDLCGRSFATKNTRNDHRTTHTGERTYVCHICGKTFKTANCVYVHRRTHTDYAPHKCSSCNKCFRTKQRLNNHLAIHTGEKPFMCQICGKRFITKSQVNCHVEIHSCIRPHICSHCGVSYSVKKYLRVHLRTHHGRAKEESEMKKPL